MSVVPKIVFTSLVGLVAMLTGLQSHAGPADFLEGEYRLTQERYGFCQDSATFSQDALGNYSFSGFYFSRVGQGWIDDTGVVPGQGRRARTSISGSQLVQEEVYYGGLQNSAKTVVQFTGRGQTLRLRHSSTALGRTVTVEDCSYRRIR